MRDLVTSPVLWLKNLVGRSRWSIGIYVGDAPHTVAPPPGKKNPVLTRHSVTDAFASLVADPFMIRVDGTWHMFFEVLTLKAGSWIGVISHATSRDGFTWDYQRVVLAEPFHLSYPYVFEWEGDFYMVPESQQAGAVRLYRADPFPTRWSFVADLVRGPVLFDSSVFHRDGAWWMFTETAPGFANTTLRLFQASALTGPWREHPRSPIVTGDARVSRPAGRVLATADRLVRFAQDCVPAYGTGVRAFEITTLSATEYEEHELGEDRVLGPGGSRWNRRGMHQLDPHPLEDGRWIACVDGWYRGIVSPGELMRRAADRFS
jgi:hypothetical protein